MKRGEGSGGRCGSGVGDVEEELRRGTARWGEGDSVTGARAHRWLFDGAGLGGCTAARLFLRPSLSARGAMSGTKGTRGSGATASAAAVLRTRAVQQDTVVALAESAEKPKGLAGYAAMSVFEVRRSGCGVRRRACASVWSRRFIRRTATTCAVCLLSSSFARGPSGAVATHHVVLSVRHLSSSISPARSTVAECCARAGDADVRANRAARKDATPLRELLIGRGVAVAFLKLATRICTKVTHPAHVLLRLLLRARRKAQLDRGLAKGSGTASLASYSTSCADRGPHHLPPARFGPYFLEPVVAGLTTPSTFNPTPRPFIATMDT